MRKPKSNEKGVSPVIAVLLMIAIAVAAAILVYVWSMGIVGTLTGGGGQQVKEQLIMDAYKWPGPSAQITMYVRNVGNAEVILDAVYVGGLNIATDMGTVIPVQGPVITVNLDAAGTGGTFTSGVAYTLKLVTKTGGVFSFSVVCGSGG